jgi:cell division protein FtsQ
VYPQEVLADEEPKFLRRQKPLEIKRRKFGRKAWKRYLQVTAWTAMGLAGSALAYEFAHFLMTSPEMSLIHTEQVEISGNRNVSRESVLEIFRPDRGHSVLRVPLDERRRQLEAIPWLEHATVRRALPHAIQVDIVERTPIAFLRDGADMALVDVHGVILDRPLQGKFHFPVVTGLTQDMAAAEREKRMQLFAGFLQQLGSARAGALEQVSEVDLSDAHDLRAILTGLQGGNAVAQTPQPGAPAEAWGQDDAPVLVHFGDSDFEAKYETLMDKMEQWRATAGRVNSVDLRFNGEAVVDTDTPVVAQRAAKPSPVLKRPASTPKQRKAAL